MAKTTAERQAVYRSKPDQYRISMYVNGEARAALNALARLTGCSQREYLESLLISAKNTAVADMTDDQLMRFYNQVTR